MGSVVADIRSEKKRLHEECKHFLNITDWDLPFAVAKWMLFDKTSKNVN